MSNANLVVTLVAVLLASITLMRKQLNPTLGRPSIGHNNGEFSSSRTPHEPARRSPVIVTILSSLSPSNDTLSAYEGSRYPLYSPPKGPPFVDNVQYLVQASWKSHNIFTMKVGFAQANLLSVV